MNKKQSPQLNYFDHEYKLWAPAGNLSLSQLTRMTLLTFFSYEIMSFPRGSITGVAFPSCTFDCSTGFLNFFFSFSISLWFDQDRYWGSTHTFKSLVFFMVFFTCFTLILSFFTSRRSQSVHCLNYITLKHVRPSDNVRVCVYTLFLSRGWILATTKKVATGKIGDPQGLCGMHRNKKLNPQKLKKKSSKYFWPKIVVFDTKIWNFWDFFF